MNSPLSVLRPITPSSDKNAPVSWRSRWFSKPALLRLLKWSLIVACVFFVTGLIAFTLLAAWVSKDLPDPNTLSTRQVPQSTKIYDRTGQVLLYEFHGDERRTLVPIDQIPTVMKQATIAVEDRKFYEHHGVYWQGVIRAVIVNTLRGKRISGTSTLTQQLVKNAIFTNERSWTRKVKELILSLQIERVYTKDQILQMYLNEIPYGSTLYGVESAAQTYFGKSAKELTLDEAALLAAIPQAPDTYSPYGSGVRGDNRSLLIARQHLILKMMSDQGFITKEQAAAATEIKTLEKLKPRQIEDIKAPHFVRYIRSILIDKYGYTVKQIEQGGLKITTTLDWDKQQAAEEEVKAGVEKNGPKYLFTNAALISLDPKTGQILAMVGSKDYFDDAHGGQVNVTLRPRQPGSSFKPIVYAEAFSRGYLPQTEMWDVATTFRTDGKDYSPNNYTGKEYGPVSLRKALQGSLNITAVKLLYLVGVGRVLDFADQLGYTTLQDRPRFGLALVLGGGEVKPLEHANAFAAFANDGISFPTSAVLEVQDATGKIVDSWTQPTGTRVMEPQVARLISNVLSDTDARTYVFGAHNALSLPDRPVAVKTGTTNSYHDAWTVGYTPSLVTALWVGNNDNQEMKKGADSSAVAAPIWQAYMKRVTKPMPIETFIAPEPPTTTNPALLGTAFVKELLIDKVSGLPATEFTPKEQTETRTYLEPHDILFYLNKDDIESGQPTNPETDPQFANWETAVQNWITKTHTTTTSAIPTIPTSTQIGTAPTITILSPTIGQTIDQRIISVRTSIESQNPVTRVSAQLGTQEVGIVTNGPPWDFGITLPPDTANGTYELTIKALDSSGNIGSATTTVQIALPGNTAIKVEAPSSTPPTP